MGHTSEYKFDSQDELFGQLLQDVMDGLAGALERNPCASMLLSGGTSPGRLYKMMSQQTLDWSRVWFGLSDERWVDANHTDSNERLVRETLLTHKAATAKFIGIKTLDEDIFDGWQRLNQQLLALPNPIDITLLGMGLDGHTASLFSDSPDLPGALEGNMLCHPIRRGEDELPRMTVTLNGLLKSREIKLLILGADKWQIYRQAKAAKSDNQPVSHLLHQTEVPISVYWAPSGN